MGLFRHLQWLCAGSEVNRLTGERLLNPVIRLCFLPVSAAKSNALQNILGKLTFNLRTLQDYSKDCNPDSSRITDSPNLWTSIWRLWGHREIASEPRWGAEGRPGMEGQGRPWSPAPRFSLWAGNVDVFPAMQPRGISGRVYVLSSFQRRHDSFSWDQSWHFLRLELVCREKQQKCVCQPLFNLLRRLRDRKSKGSTSRGQSLPKKLLEDGPASSFSQQGCASPWGRGVLA